MDNSDLISVILPVYNGENYIEEAVRSILSQTHKNLELLIVNDGSLDGTAKIISKLQVEDKRIRVIDTPNRGIISALNQGVSLASGFYIARMDADDISLDDRLEKQLAFMKRNSYHLVGGSINRFSETKNRRKYYPEKNSSLKASILSFGASIAHPTMLGEARVFSDY